jgi:hypothetical protein
VKAKQPGHRKTAVQWPYTSFVSLADGFLIAYACAPDAGIGPALFNIGHAVELYLKAILLKANPKTDASKSGHNIEKLLAKVQAMHPSLLSGYTLRKSAADKWLHNPVMPNAPDSDYDHYRHHMELYWISRFLADTKYLFASHKTIKGGFAIIYCSLNEYWQPFFREIRQHLGIPNPQSGPDVLADAVANAEIPEYARAYLRKIVYS